MSATDQKTAARTLRPRTLMVRGGTRRSANNETSEAIYMNSGYVYGSAEEAGDRLRQG